ncbi:hypothetical protein MG293_014924 [Ovis ammon polii]|uniref:Uncharacterized protein n=1 Tax=Ovis ammon polii TaxID=230172 RepID=A0AAD4TXH3_OVIAM|nr:hypothetical protein MG293_014924 [Ovis ammon polii]
MASDAPKPQDAPWNHSCCLWRPGAVYQRKQSGQIYTTSRQNCRNVHNSDCSKDQASFMREKELVELERGRKYRGPITGCGLLLHCVNKVGVYRTAASPFAANPHSARADIDVAISGGASMGSVQSSLHSEGIGHPQEGLMVTLLKHRVINRPYHRLTDDLKLSMLMQNPTAFRELRLLKTKYTIQGARDLYGDQRIN